MIAPRPQADQTVTRLPTLNADVNETHSLLLLPSELLIENLRHLDYRSILRCSSVCRELKKVIDSSVELQYRIELALDCMLDGPPSTLTVSERLEQLRDLRRAWTLFEWKKEIRVPMSGCCQAYELVGGVFAKTSNFQGGIFSHFGSRHFVSTWLPSSSDPGRSLVRNDLGIATRDFAIDPTQDLIALVKTDEDMSHESGYIEVYIRTISSNVQHPAAASPMLRTFSSFPMNNAFIQIVEDVVGMLFWTEPAGGRIAIWNWETGKMLVDRSIDHLPPNISDFSFISSRAYMVTRGIGGGAIQVFTFGEDEDDIVHVADLSLPPLKPRTHIVHSNIHTGPFIANCPPGASFWTNQEDRMYVLSVQYIQVDPDAPSARPKFCIFFNSSTPLRYIRKYREQRPESHFEVPWEEWGPQGTRMLHHQVQYQWLRYVHGHRVVFPVPPGSMQVLDFNIRKSERHAFPLRPNSSASIEVVDYPSTILSDNIFLWPIETSLPYRICLRDELQGFSGVMVDERRLIGLKSPTFADGDMKDLHVFAF